MFCKAERLAIVLHIELDRGEAVERQFRVGRRSTSSGGRLAAPARLDRGETDERQFRVGRRSTSSGGRLAATRQPPGGRGRGRGCCASAAAAHPRRGRLAAAWRQPGVALSSQLLSSC